MSVDRPRTRAGAAVRDLLRMHTPLRLRPRLRALARGVWRRVWNLPSEDIERWEQRATQFGKRAVFNLGHSELELERVTELQKTTLYPLLRKHLDGSERLVLDLGCGPGRFTADLAQMVNGQAVGVDPIQRLLDLAPAGPGVEFRRMNEGHVPLDDGEADVVWICLVLGGLRDDVLRTTLTEMRRVLRPGGLVFLVENTTVAKDSIFWHFRSVAHYQGLFAPMTLSHVHDYEDLGERISVFVGRRPT